MTRRALGATLLLLAVAAALAWWLGRGPGVPDAAVDAGIARIDAANEGRRVSVRGPVEVVASPRDTDLGIEAPGALVLVREVAMLQWQEHCQGNRCSHRLDWSSAPVRSDAFREPQGHANPGGLPFADARFAARDVRMGAFGFDADGLFDDGAAVDFPVRLAQLPPNLAATFRECAGALCTGDEAAPAAGDLRVRYRVVPTGTRNLVGLQRGDRLEAVTAR